MIRNSHLPNTFSPESGWYQIRFPSDWITDESEDCVSLFNPDGVGALQISAYEVTTNEGVENILREFLEDDVLRKEPSIGTVKRGRKQIAFCEYLQGEERFRVWVIKVGRHVLFVTYNSENTLKDIERSEVTAIIESAEIEP